MTKNQELIQAYLTANNALKQDILIRNKGDQKRADEEINQVLGK